MRRSPVGPEGPVAPAQIKYINLSIKYESSRHENVSLSLNVVHAFLRGQTPTSRNFTRFMSSVNPRELQGRCTFQRQPKDTSWTAWRDELHSCI